MDALQLLLTDHSLEASLLAAFANDPDLLWQWSDRLPDKVFANQEYQALYKAQQEAAAAEKALPLLPDPAAPAAAPNDTAEQLISLYQRRRLTALCQSVLHKVREAQDADELLAALVGDVADLEAERGEFLAASLIAARALLPSLWADLKARAKAAEDNGIPGISTGFRHLDQLTNGLEPGLYLLAGPPKAGKTTFVNQLAYQVAAGGMPVVYLSFENDALDLLLKQLCRLGQQPLLKAQKGQADEGLLRAASGRLEREVEDRLYYVQGHAEMTSAKVRAKAKQALAAHGVGRGLVVIDYLQKMALVKPSGGDMRDCVNRLSLQLRDLARELDSPVLAVASLSREGYRPGSKPNVATLKESGNLEYDADAVWLLDASEELRPGLRKATLTVAAARRSPTGNVDMILNQACGQFAEVDDASFLPVFGGH